MTNLFTPNIEKMKARKNIQGLIKALGFKSDPHIRSTAAKVLGSIGGKEVIVPLQNALQDEDKWVRKNAVEALGIIGDPASIGPLINSLKDKEGHVVMEAAIALGKYKDPQSIDPLLEVLKNKEGYIYARREAAIALGKIGDKKIVPELIPFLRREADLQLGVIEALGNFTDPDLIQHLKPKLTHSNEFIRRQTVMTLGGIDDNQSIKLLISSFTDENASVRKAATEALDKLGWRPQADENGAAYWIVKENWNQCVEIGEKAIKPLIRILSEKDNRPLAEQNISSRVTQSFNDRKSAAAKTLGQIGLISAVNPLIKYLTYPDTGVRRQVVIALGQIGDKRALDPLLKLYKSALGLSVVDSIEWAIEQIKLRNQFSDTLQDLLTRK